MKKIIIVLLGVMVITLANTSRVEAQGADKGIAFASFKNTAALMAYANENSITEKDKSSADKESLKSAEADFKATKANLKALKANFRATASFKKEFQDVANVDWMKSSDAISATFSKDGVKTLAVYDSKGFWIHTINYLPAEKTPEKVRSIIENSYPDADILLTMIVKEGNMDFFIAQLEDKRTYKKVSIYNDEINCFEQLTKAGK